MSFGGFCVLSLQKAPQPEGRTWPHDLGNSRNPLGVLLQLPKLTGNLEAVLLHCGTRLVWPSNHTPYKEGFCGLRGTEGRLLQVSLFLFLLPNLLLLCLTFSLRFFNDRSQTPSWPLLHLCPEAFQGTLRLCRQDLCHSLHGRGDLRDSSPLPSLLALWVCCSPALFVNPKVNQEPPGSTPRVSQLSRPLAQGPSS